MAEQMMTKGEREDLIRLVKQRERVAKSLAEQRSAAMLVEFEHKMSGIHSFATNEVWHAAHNATVAAGEMAAKELEAAAEKMGIPQEFRPKISFHWQRDSERAYNAHRDQLRKVAKAEIEALERMARTQIEAASIDAQTQIISNGLTTAAAMEFLKALPAVETMMPELDPMYIQQRLAERARISGGLSLVE